MANPRFNKQVANSRKPMRGGGMSKSLSMLITTTTKSAPEYCIERHTNNPPNDNPINEPEANPMKNITDLNLLLPIASNNAIHNIAPQAKKLPSITA